MSFIVANILKLSRAILMSAKTSKLALNKSA